MTHSASEPKTRKVKIGLVQMRCQADPDANMARGEAAVKEASARGAQIVCLPELFRSLYFCQTEDAALFDLAEPIPGPSTERLGALARSLGIVLIAPLFERRAPGLYHNSAVVMDPTGTMIGHYRKMHIPDDPLYYEKFYFTPGDLGFPSFPTPFGRIAVLICWDQWFPEGARLAALSGAEILFYPTAIGWHQHERATLGDDQHAAWEAVQRGHAVANGVFVAAANRVGAEGTVDFWGRSFVFDPIGKRLATADESETVLVVDCDLGRIEEIRRGWPLLRDRRVDAYGPIQRRFLV